MLTAATGPVARRLFSLPVLSIGMTDHRPIGVALENRLMSHGIYVLDVQRLSNAGGSETDPDDLPDGTGFTLEYETVSDSPGIDTDEVGAVVRTLLDIANEREWTPGRLEVTSLTTEGDVRGHWHVKREWFDALGLEYDDLEFSQRVLETRRTDVATDSRSH
ncbi:hypothetical protein C496_01191 [Natronorubrum tibetense GA33]|uniref:DUF8159 domain-containing protein n=2 Tax=Natronorubrum tibetense TaxID=63128 RepID=L9W9K6_9EURY|nr:hypothetical protein C496_01191 [Natronorubrum tibetense GA33]